MKYSEITFDLILRALRRQWKVLLSCVVAFTAVGMIAGFVWADDLAASPKGAVVDGLLIPDFSGISYDANYYLSCSNQLSEAAARAENCLSFVSDATLNETQREQMEALEEQFAALRETVLIPLWQQVSAGAYVPEGHMEQAEHLYEVRLRTAETALQSAADARKYLAQWNVSVPPAEEFQIDALKEEQKPYAAILEDAVRYEFWEEQIAFYNRALTQLQEHPEEVVAQSQEVEKALDWAKEKLGTFVLELQAVVVEIAETENLDIFVFYNEMEDGYYINLENPLSSSSTKQESGYDAKAIYEKRIIIHNHGYRSQQDAFLILTLFCFLVGICSGVFFAVCRQSREEAEQSPLKNKKN